VLECKPFAAIVAWASITVPNDDLMQRQPKMVHLGCGAFLRCHLADDADDLLHDQIDQALIRAMNLRPPDLERFLLLSGRSQACL